MLGATSIVAKFAVLLLLFGLQAEANSGDGYYAFMNSTGSNSQQLLDYNRYIGPNSPVDIHIKRALQVVENHDSLPYCQKMAASSLIHSCATLEGEPSNDEETQGMPQEPKAIVGNEKTLYATRLAVCELSDSKVPVPKQCKSFVPTEENTKKTGWLGYLPVPGVWKSVLRYPDYEEATKRDHYACVAALHDSPQAWSSYSNARQDAVKLCHAVRGDVEKDQLLQLHKSLVEVVADSAEALRHEKESIRDNEEAWNHLALKSQQIADDLLKDNIDLRAKYRQTLVDADKIMQQVHAQIAQMNSTMKDSNIQLRASGEDARAVVSGLVSVVSDALQDHRTGLALALGDAENVQERIQYGNEIFQQQIMQSLDKAARDAKSVSVLQESALQTLQEINVHGLNATEQLQVIVLALGEMGNFVSQLKGDHEDLRSSINETKEYVAELSKEVLAISGHISAIVGMVAGAFGHLPATVWYLCSIGLIIGTLVFLNFCPGGPWVLRSLAGIVTHTFVATGGLLRACAEVLVQTWDAAGNVLLAVLIIASIATYSTVFEPPITMIERWQASGIPLLEAALVFTVVVILVVLLVAISRRHLAAGNGQDESEPEVIVKAEKKHFRFNDPKAYQHGKWIV